MDILTTCFLDLSKKFEEKKLPLIMGGGYGLFLKQSDLASISAQTVLKASDLPEARSTEDMDMFVAGEILVSLENSILLKTILDELGYEPIATSYASFWQFRLPKARNPSGLPVKIDILTEPVSTANESKLKIRRDHVLQRIRNKDLPEKYKFHARETDEALELEKQASKVRVAGKLSSGEDYVGEVSLPSAFTYLMMKLITYEDQLKLHNERTERDTELRESGQEVRPQGDPRYRRHAVDTYRIIGMMTESEFDQCKSSIKERADCKIVGRAKEIALKLFGDDAAIGILDIRQTSGFPYTEENMNTFLNTLKSLFE